MASKTIAICSQCGCRIDTKADPEYLVYVGNMRRLHGTIALCEVCRELERNDQDRLETESNKYP